MLGIKLFRVNFMSATSEGNTEEKTVSRRRKREEDLPDGHIHYHGGEKRFALLPAPDPALTALPECRLLIYNVSKKHNVGSILRSAVAFGVREVVVVGMQKLDAFGNQGTLGFLRFVHFTRLENAVAYLKRHQFRILGVEIDESSAAIETHPFVSNTCFVLGNEGQGLVDKVKVLCDGYVYIRQVGIGTASLNVAVAAAIVLHHFALWAKYPERSRSGQKYEVQATQGHLLSQPPSQSPHTSACTTDSAVVSLSSSSSENNDGSQQTSGS